MGRLSGRVTKFGLEHLFSYKPRTYPMDWCGAKIGVSRGKIASPPNTKNRVDFQTLIFFIFTTSPASLIHYTCPLHVVSSIWLEIECPTT